VARISKDEGVRKGGVQGLASRGGIVCVCVCVCLVFSPGGALLKRRRLAQVDDDLEGKIPDALQTGIGYVPKPTSLNLGSEAYIEFHSRQICPQ